MLERRRPDFKIQVTPMNLAEYMAECQGEKYVQPPRRRAYAADDCTG
jgi:hypothetical protein